MRPARWWMPPPSPHSRSVGWSGDLAERAIAIWWNERGSAAGPLRTGDHDDLVCASFRGPPVRRSGGGPRHGARPLPVQPFQPVRSARRQSRDAGRRIAAPVLLGPGGAPDQRVLPPRPGCRPYRAGFGPRAASGCRLPRRQQRGRPLVRRSGRRRRLGLRGEGRAGQPQSRGRWRAARRDGGPVHRCPVPDGAAERAEQRTGPARLPGHRQSPRSRCRRSRGRRFDRDLESQAPGRRLRLPALGRGAERNGGERRRPARDLQEDQRGTAAAADHGPDRRSAADADSGGYDPHRERRQ